MTCGRVCSSIKKTSQMNVFASTFVFLLFSLLFDKEWKMLVILHNQQLQLLLCMALLFLHFLQTESHPKQLRQGDIACRYGVGHPPSVAQNADTVSVSLVNTETGRSSMCYEGNVTYYSKLLENKKLFLSQALLMIFSFNKFNKVNIGISDGPASWCDWRPWNFPLPERFWT